MSEQRTEAGAGPLPSGAGHPSELFERFPYGLALVDSSRAILSLNRPARELLTLGQTGQAHEPRTCCELICRRASHAPGGECMTRRALASTDPLPEIRIDIENGRSQAAAWVTASKLDPDGSRLLFHLRPGAPNDRRRRTVHHGIDGVSSAKPTLRISTLGDLRVERGDGRVAGDWLKRRPGDLLRYLICNRGAIAPEDQIAEALWPGAGYHNASNRVRQTVYALRERLEPERATRSPAEFVVSSQGGYRLDPERVWVDVDRFEDQVRAGLTALSQGQEEIALTHLEDAISLYRGEFLADYPYLDWALEERNRLREMAGQALLAVTQVHSEAGDLAAAKEPARRLAAMEPFDTDVQRDFLELCVKQGKRSEATRRYELLKMRMRKEFGEEPDFSLSDLGSRSES